MGHPKYGFHFYVWAIRRRKSCIEVGEAGGNFTCMKFLACFLLISTAAFVHSQSPKALLLFGGADHKTFLGCLNCIDTSESSLCNEFGKYGSKFQSDSIWNEFGTYGSEFNSLSPWNEYSSSAPIIVDKDGMSYGYFSINGFHHDRTRIKWLVQILDFQEKHSDLEKTRDLMCKP